MINLPVCYLSTWTLWSRHISPLHMIDTAIFRPCACCLRRVSGTVLIAAISTSLHNHTAFVSGTQYSCYQLADTSLDIVNSVWHWHQRSHLYSSYGEKYLVSACYWAVVYVLDKREEETPFTCYCCLFFLNLMIAVLFSPLLILFSVYPPNPSPHLPSTAHPADTEPSDPARPQPSGPELQAAAPALLWPSAVHPAEPAAVLGPAEWCRPGTPAEPLYPPPEAQPVLDRQPRGSHPDRLQQVRLSGVDLGRL